MLSDFRVFPVIYILFLDLLRFAIRTLSVLYIVTVKPKSYSLGRIHYFRT